MDTWRIGFMRSLKKSAMICGLNATFAAGLVVAVWTLPGCAPAPTSASANAKPKAESIPAGKASSDEVTSSVAASPKKEEIPVRSEAVKTEVAKAETSKTEVTKPAEFAKSAKPHSLDQVAPLIPRKVLFGNPEKAGARMSPDGKQLAYVAPVDGVLNVWVGPIDNPDAAKPVTQEKSRPVHGFNWAYTNKHILYSQDSGGDENFHVFAVNLDTGVTTDITPLKDPSRKIDVTVKEADRPKVPDNEKVTAQIQEVSWKRPEKILIGINERNQQFHDIYEVDLITGEHKIVQENPGFAGFLTD
jgi:hypothetical protein